MGNRRTDPELLADVLKAFENNQASASRLSQAMDWEIDKVQRVVDRAIAEGQLSISRGPGGVIKYRGGERMGSNGFYADVARVIRDYWGQRNFGLRNVDTIETAKAGTRGSGVWTHPDLVIAADPARRDSPDEPRRLHAVEVETKSGFDIRSVYQAHAQGRGADYTWVFGDKSPGVPELDWDRIMWTAAELGVGLVTFTKSGAYGTWTHHLDAERKRPTAEEREGFIKLTVGPALRDQYGL